MSDMERQPDVGSRPVPDPTVLTTDAVEKAASVSKEYTDGRVAVLEQRLSDMDRATEVLNETVHRTPTDIQREVLHLRELTDAKIASVCSELEHGDAALRDHVLQQVEQLRAALVATQREIKIMFDASQEAIRKAEELNKERWDANERWRDQTVDRERSTAEEMSRRAATFVRAETAEAQFDRLRENADTQIAELRRAVLELSERVSKLV